MDKSVLRKRRKRAEKAVAEGRVPGVIGRPPILDFQSSEHLRNKILKDSESGIFHPVAWVADMVCIFFFFLIGI
ncbi:MAG: hypothetical protein LBD32_00870 [Cytophagales bacterium]|nr:hypothetical protein [Cytophagales bacterium]